MERLGKIPLESVLPNIGMTAARRDYCGQSVNMASKRLLCFALHGTKCAECGLEGKFFAVERHLHQHTKSFHINLYALDGDGEEILMTQDHVKPRAQGGKSDLDNLRTLCTRCNSIKGSGWFVYLVRCSDNSLYCGMTNNLKGRLKEHNAGYGAKYVRSRRPIKLVYSETVADKSSALKREAEIKSWDKDAKEALVAGLPGIVSFPADEELAIPPELVRRAKETADWIKSSAGSPDIVGQPKGVSP